MEKSPGNLQKEPHLVINPERGKYLFPKGKSTSTGYSIMHGPPKNIHTSNIIHTSQAMFRNNFAYSYTYTHVKEINLKSMR